MDIVLGESQCASECKNLIRERPDWALWWFWRWHQRSLV